MTIKRGCLGFIVFAAFALISAPLVLGASPRLPLKVGTSKFYGGYIDRGEAFGIAIGDARSTVASRLRSEGISPLGELPCDEEWRALIACTPGQRADVYHFSTLLRRGNLNVEYSGGKVKTLSWLAYFWPYIDF